MLPSNIPQGFAVVQLENQQWYPIKVDYFYSADYPEGSPCLNTLIGWKENQPQHDTHFQQRDEAIAHCQQEAISEQETELRKWQRLTIKSNVYPDRCIHYIDLITEITGYAPVVRQFPYSYDPFDGISVSIRSWHCTYNWHTVDVVEGSFLIEDALEDAATSVYASYQACQCSQKQF